MVSETSLEKQTGRNQRKKDRKDSVEAQSFENHVMWRSSMDRGGLNLGKRCLVNRVFLNPLFGEPVVCTPDSRGFRHFRGFHKLTFRNPALNSLFVAV